MIAPQSVFAMVRVIKIRHGSRAPRLRMSEDRSEFEPCFYHLLITLRCGKLLSAIL